MNIILFHFRKLAVIPPATPTPTPTKYVLRAREYDDNGWPLS